MGQEYRRDSSIVSNVNFNLEPELFDDFEGILQWVIEDAGNISGAVTKDTTIALSGSASLLLDTGATAPADGDNIAASRKCPLGPGRYLDLKASFQPNDGGFYWTMNFGFYANRQGTVHQPTVRLLQATGEIQVRTGAAAYTTVNTVNSFYTGWGYIRCVVDLVTKKYKYLVINSQVLDVSAYSYYTDTDTEYGFTQANFELVNVGAHRIRMNIDNVVISVRDSF